jgi:hypothetical protein
MLQWNAIVVSDDEISRLPFLQLEYVFLSLLKDGNDEAPKFHSL